MPGFESLTNGDIPRKRKMLAEVSAISLQDGRLLIPMHRSLMAVGDLATNQMTNPGTHLPLMLSSPILPLSHTFTVLRH